MRTSQIMTAALFALALTATPATAETVSFELDKSASQTELYSEISEQARKACAADRHSSSVLSRAGNIRKCQKRLIADVVEALNSPTVTVLAKADGVELKAS
ncbi:MAG: UrcA family protein [Henriciella sp.]